MSGTFKESYIIYTYTYLCYRLIMNIFKHQYVFISLHLDVFEINMFVIQCTFYFLFIIGF